MKRVARIAILVTVPLSCLAGLLALQAQGVVQENAYRTVLRLEKESAKIGLIDRTARASELAGKVLHAYERLASLAFEETTTYYWCKAASYEASLPFPRWGARREVADVRVACTPTSQRVEIRVAGKALCTYLVNGDSAQPKNPPIPALADPELVCATGIHNALWIGKTAHQPRDFHKKLDLGEWIGAASVDGEKCDVVLTSWQSSRWAYFVNQGGVVVLWVRIEPYSSGGYDTLVRVKHYFGIEAKGS